MKAPADTYIIDIQCSDGYQPLNHGLTIPSQQCLTSWVRQLLAWLKQPEYTELSVLITDAEQMQTLNANYRQKNKPTNVLSFPARVPEGFAQVMPVLGDIIICAPVVEQEAHDQQKASEAHWAHMLAHGVLHLLGYDHMTNEEAEIMEQKEIDLLTKLGFSNPYI